MDVSYIAGLVRPYVSGCPLPTIESAVNRTLIDFCRRTQIWEEELRPVYVAAGDTTFEAVKSDRQQILVVSKLLIDDVETEAYSATPPRQIVLDEAPEATVTAVATAILAPAFGCSTVPEVVEPWLEAVENGTIARLAAMPGFEWSSAETHNYRQGLYTNLVDDATAAVLREGRNQVFRVRAW